MNHKYCKDCENCTHGSNSASAVCHALNEYTGLPRQTSCISERNGLSTQGYCGPDARFYVERK